MKIGALILFAIFMLGSCAVVPGTTKEEQVHTIEDLHAQTLQALYAQYPQAKAQIEKSVGYVIMENNSLKIPIFGGSKGYGFALNRSTHERTYLRLNRFDVGAGWGVRQTRPILIIYNQEKFDDFISGKWIFTSGGEAAAKAGDIGVAGGGNVSDISSTDSEKIYDFYLLTDAGVSATITAAVIRVSPINLKEK